MSLYNKNNNNSIFRNTGKMIHVTNQVALTDMFADMLTTRLTTSLSDGLTTSLTDGLSEGISDRLTTSLTDGLVEGISDRLTTSLSDGLTTSLTDGLAEGISDRLTGTIPSRVYQTLYNTVGEPVKNILNAFVDGSDELQVLLAYDNYAALSEKFMSVAIEDNEYYERFRNILIDAVEGTKNCDNRMKEQEHAYKKLLDAYNFLLSDKSHPPLFSVEAEIGVEAEVLPEILEYIRRGYKIVDDNGKLIPIDMNILAQIRNEFLIL